MKSLKSIFVTIIVCLGLLSLYSFGVTWQGGWSEDRVLLPELASAPGTVPGWGSYYWDSNSLPIGIDGSGNALPLSSLNMAVGPTSATDSAVALFDGTTGKLLKSSNITVDATGDVVTAKNIFLRDFASGNESIAAILNETINRGVLDAITVTADAGIGSAGRDISWTTGEVWDHGNTTIVETTADTQTCADDDITYLYWVSGPNLTKSTTAPSGNNVIVAEIFVQNGVIWEIETYNIVSEREAEISAAAADMFVAVVAEGLILEPADDLPFDVDVSAGLWFHHGFERHTIAATIESPVMVRWWRDASGNWDHDTSNQIDADFYDQDGANTITANDNAKWYRSSFFLDGEETVHWPYPRAGYVTKAQAIAAPCPPKPDALEEFPRLACVVLRGDASDFPVITDEQWIDTRPRMGSVGPGPISDHGDLAGLSDPDHKIDDLADADTSTASPGLNEVLKWDGSNWVPAVYAYEFEFSIASFTDNQSTTLEIGSGEWKATAVLTFDMTYNNGPPTAGEVILSSNGGVSWGSNLALTTPFTTKDSAEGTDYPNDKDKYITFTLDVDKDAENDTDTETIYFRNNIFWGVIAKSGSFTEADIEGLGNSAVSNTINRSFAVNAGGGEYIVYAYPTSYTAMDEGDDYEDDGGTDFKFNSIAIAMTQDNAVLEITNTAGTGFADDYDIYVSDVAALGNHTFQVNTGGLTINTLYYGVTEKTDTFLEADIEGLANSTPSNDNTQAWDAVTAGAIEYLLFAFPKRLGAVTFWVGGFAGGFEAAETVSVTNTNGWAEDYFAWRSTNVNLGETEVTTQ